MNDNDTQLDNTSTASTETPVERVAQPATTEKQPASDEWQKRFIGLQGKYQQEYAKWAETSAKVLDLSQALEKTTGEKEAISLEYQNATEKMSQMETELEIAKANLERVQIISGEYPELLPFLQKGLIPDGSGDELRETLKTFQETIGSLKQSAKTDFIAGASPKEGQPAAVPENQETILKQMFDAMASNNIALYNELYEKNLNLKKGDK